MGGGVMTALLPAQEQPEIKGDSAAELRELAAVLRIQLAAVIDKVVERKVIDRQNYGYYPPTPEELAEIDKDGHAFWYQVANQACECATTPAVKPAPVTAWLAELVRQQHIKCELLERVKQAAGRDGRPAWAIEQADREFREAKTVENFLRKTLSDLPAGA